MWECAIRLSLQGKSCCLTVGCVLSRQPPAVSPSRSASAAELCLLHDSHHGDWAQQRYTSSGISASALINNTQGPVRDLRVSSLSLSSQSWFLPFPFMSWSLVSSLYSFKSISECASGELLVTLESVLYWVTSICGDFFCEWISFIHVRNIARLCLEAVCVLWGQSPFLARICDGNMLGL